MKLKNSKNYIQFLSFFNLTFHIEKTEYLNENTILFENFKIINNIKKNYY